MMALFVAFVITQSQICANPHQINNTKCYGVTKSVSHWEENMVFEKKNVF